MYGLPLEGVTILDLSRQLPGPVATQILADFGADVIKIEDTGEGDSFRSVPPLKNGMSMRHVVLNRNKRGLAINLKTEEGLAVFMKLAASADVILEQFRPGVVNRLGIDYESVRKVNEKIVYCSLSGFGQTGPYRDVVAHDPNYLAVSGILGLLGRRNQEPAMTGPQLSDLSGAHMTTIGLLMALRKAEQTGQGEYLDISMFDSAFSLAITSLSNYLATGESVSRGEERHNGRYPWSDIYETADGGFITVSAIESHFYRNLCLSLDKPEWVEQQYADDETLERIRAEMREIFLTRTRDEWFDLLKDKQVCISPVLTIGEAAESGHVAARGNLFEHEHPVAGKVRLPASPIKMKSVSAAQVRIPAPVLGQHSSEILKTLGYSQEDVDRLVEQGVIVAPRP